MDDHLLFQSIRTHKELSRQQAYRIIHHAAEELGLCHIGLTTLRKTFAYHAYQSGILLQSYKIFRSSDNSRNGEIYRVVCR